MTKILSKSGSLLQSDEPARFLSDYPQYERTRILDEARRTEYAHLDRSGHIYLDYTGSGLAAAAQYRAHTERLTDQCFGNPHSENPASRASTQRVERARAAVLAHFNADPRQYTAIFTANATGACRLVAEAYRFEHDNRFVLTFDNHNSVNGIREYARTRRTPVHYVPGDGVELRTDTATVRAALSKHMIGRRGPAGLFAFPAQSNFSGVRHPLEWVELAHRHGFDVLLDAASYVPTSPLDLSAVQPEFVAVSWYKVFGYPTGIGCLIARRDALARLRRPWFSGGTIQAVSVQGDWHAMAPDESAFEDGTVNFLSIPDVEFGLRWLHNLRLDLIDERVSCLTGWLLHRLGGLTHGNGAPMIRIYGPRDTKDRGGTVAFNFLDPDGRIVDERLVEREAAAARISVRTGCFCNPGAGELAFGIGRGALRGRISRKARSIDEYLHSLRLPSGGAVRVSLGMVSNVADVEGFIDFCERTYRDRQADSEGLPPRERC
ncbi:aminotransferase class V-fold PLP-dependent enzyme [Actinocrinis puniceicyclus]|uniref:Aminotransferase class V-fold PLP-dependent enzyme n=1 Tax=Actinocrinis puniceicyclus TaxID=977794 RepID=A0A8J8BDZ2_9ACTN|nr:aminotransferase class V-fold PLP-dependent enzyme [Actinocrinis puniceicyclus]MBS2965798.1 aminotransferase class V-fold PLP-dependent enzyme [Actinocrinis puniceicyclus]